MENQNNTNQSQQIIYVQAPSNPIRIGKPFVRLSYVLAIAFFFFSFCDFKCNDTKLLTVTGIDLVTGKEIKPTKLFDDKQTINDENRKEIPPMPWAIGALALAVVGLLVSFVKFNKEDELATGVGILGIVCMIFLYTTINNKVKENGESIISVEFLFPFWGVICAYGITVLLSTFRINSKRNIPENIVQTEIEQPPAVVNEVSNNSSQATHQEEIIETESWFQENKKIVLSFLGIAAFVVAMYFIITIKPKRHFDKSLAIACIDTSSYRIDSVLNPILINGKTIFIALTKDKYNSRHEKIDISGFDGYSLQMIDAEEQKIVYSKKTEGTIFLGIDTFRTSQNIYIVMEQSVGSGSTTYYFKIALDRDEKIKEFFHYSDLDFILWNNKGNEIIKFDGIWEVDECHTCEHKYKISTLKYFENGKVTQIYYPQTQYKYGFYKNDFSLKDKSQLINEIKANEPQLLSSIDLSEFEIEK